MHPVLLKTFDRDQTKTVDFLWDETPAWLLGLDFGWRQFNFWHIKGETSGLPWYILAPKWRNRSRLIYVLFGFQKGDGHSTESSLAYTQAQTELVAKWSLRCPFCFSSTSSCSEIALVCWFSTDSSKPIDLQELGGGAGGERMHRRVSMGKGYVFNSVNQSYFLSC